MVPSPFTTFTVGLRFTAGRIPYEYVGPSISVYPELSTWAIWWLSSPHGVNNHQ